MRKGGASGPAFESIVAFGERAALPHARPTAKRLKKGQLVVLDLGAILNRYCSDITRTVFVGKAPAKVRLWYQAVLEAQAAAIAAVAAGRTCGDVDAAARGVLAAYRLDQYFVHSTGHGWRDHYFHIRLQQRIDSGGITCGLCDGQRRFVFPRDRKAE